MSAAARPRQGRLPAAWSGESQGEAMAELARRIAEAERA